MTASWTQRVMSVTLAPALLLALVAGCANQAPKPPSLTPAAVAPAAAPAGAATAYLSADQINSTALIEPPPVAGSEAERADLQAVLEAQRAAHEQGTTARAVADTVIDCQRVADVLIPDAVAGGEGAAAVAFATRVAKQVSAATNAPKTHWQRPRPYVLSTAVERLGDVAPDSPFAIKGGYERAHTSYPSGHSAFGTGCAIVLAQMVPEQAGALFARAQLYGESRLIVGAHFRTDVDAGRRVGTAAAAAMLQNAQFQADLHAARAQLRQALGLPETSSP